MPVQAAEAERRVLEAARKARAEVEAQLAEKDPEAMGLDASGRRLLSQNRAMAKELELHIEVLGVMCKKICSSAACPGQPATGYPSEWAYDRCSKQFCCKWPLPQRDEGCGNRCR